MVHLNNKLHAAVHQYALQQMQASPTVKVGDGIHGKTTLTYGDHDLTQSNWVYILIICLVVTALAGGIGFCIYKRR